MLPERGCERLWNAEIKSQLLSGHCRDGGAGQGTCLRRNFGAIIVKTIRLSPPAMWKAQRADQLLRPGLLRQGAAQVAAGERYELCRSVHAGANAIIHAQRADMLTAPLPGGPGRCPLGSIIRNATSCAMCKRMVINAGIARVIVRDDRDNYRIIQVA